LDRPIRIAVGGSPSWVAALAVLNLSHPFYEAADSTATDDNGFFGQFTTSLVLGNNRNPCTDGFSDATRTAAQHTQVTATSGSSYHGFLTSPTVNIVPVEHFRIAPGVSVGTGNLTTDPGAGVLKGGA
jgi:hypothetical protein